jgi:hypothetical protein
MSRHIISLNTKTDRLKAHQGVDRAPPGYVLELREPKRSDEQNRALWSLLNQIQRQRPEHRGVQMTPDLWKIVFMDALGSEGTIMPKLDQPGFFATPRLTKTEFADLITLILAWSAREGLTIEHFDGDPVQERAA